MRFWFFSTDPNHSRRHQHPAPPVRPLLEPLEDRCLLSANFMPASTSAASSSASTPAAAGNTIASLAHDQIHVLQAQSQQQTAIATIRLEEEQAVLGILQLFAPQVPQVQPAIAFLTSIIPAQQVTVNTLQNQTNLLNQLDDLQDQALILNAMIQNAAALVPVQQQLDDIQVANMLQSIIAVDQTAVQALQPQIAAVEVEVSTFA
jgi:hypothetical protein